MYPLPKILRARNVTKNEFYSDGPTNMLGSALQIFRLSRFARPTTDE